MAQICRSSLCCSAAAGPSGRAPGALPLCAHEGGRPSLLRLRPSLAPQRAAPQPRSALAVRAAAASSAAAATAGGPTPTAVASVSGPSAGPFATLSKVLLSQPNNMLKTLTNKAGGPRVLGPVSLLLFLVTMLGGALAALRYMLVRKVKACGSCRGYGIQRCRLCEGAGRVAWKAKLQYASGCPLCMNKRFITCQECGGYHNKMLFSHLRRSNGDGALVTASAAGQLPQDMPLKEKMSSASD
jgi:hypothetical protein